MNWRFLILFLCLPALSRAADCDLSSHTRSGPGTSYSIKRLILADGKTTNVTSTKCTMAELHAQVPFDFYRFWAEEGNTCSTWTALVRDYPADTNTAQCRGTCDPVDLQTLTRGGTISKMFYEPLGEAFDVVTTNVNCSGGLTIYLDLYYRDMGR